MPDGDFDRFRRRQLRSVPLARPRPARPRYARAYGTRDRTPARRSRRPCRTWERRCCRDCTRGRSSTCGARSGRGPRRTSCTGAASLALHLPAGQCGPARRVAGAEHEPVHPRARPGHDQFALDPVRSRRSAGRDGAAGVHAALPALRLGRTRRGGDLGDAGSDDHGSAGARTCDAPRRCGDRHHEPARDDCAVGPRDRAARGTGDRLAGPAHGRRVPAPEGRRPRSRRRAPHWIAARSLFLGHQARVAARQRARRARARGARRTRVRHDRQLARLEARRAGNATSPTSTNASRTLLLDLSDRRPGTPFMLELLRIPRALLPTRRAVVAAATTRRSPRSAGTKCRSAASPATSRPRCSARPASSRAWPRTPTAPAASC